MTVVEILKAAKAKIENPDNWTQGFYAKDSDGNTVFGCNERAVCFCALGAVQAVVGDLITHNLSANRAWHYLDDAVRPGYNRIAVLNDKGTHAEVLAAFDRAIAEAERAQ
jgi:hypothetical protein